MSGLTRAPVAQLQPWVECLWAQRNQLATGPTAEHVLPTGSMHLVIRLVAPPLCLLDGEMEGPRFGHAVVGGARSAFYRRRLDAVTDSVGAVLRPGAAQALFGVPAHELADSHVDLDALWGRSAQDLRERLLEREDLSSRLALFEAQLLARVRKSTPPVPPWLAGALCQVQQGMRIGDIVAGSGFSHRHISTCFRAQVGLTPKAYARVLRFRQLLKRLSASSGTVAWAELATDCGYADQAHLVREFRELAGVTPGTYRRLAPVHAHHLVR